MIKIFLLFLLITLNILADNQRVVLYENENYYINEENISFIVSDKNLVKFTNENGSIEVISVKTGVDSLTVFKNDGSIKTYFFEIKSANQSSLSLNKRNKTYLGKIKYNHYFDSKKNTSNSFNYYHRLLIKENLKFEFSHSYFEKNREVDYNNIDFYTLSYSDMFLSWFRQAIEPNTSIPYYSSLPFEGYIIGKKGSKYEIKGWTGNKSTNRKKMDDVDYKGFFYNQKWKEFETTISGSHNPSLNYFIPIYKIYLKNYFINITTSNLDEKQLNSFSFYKDFNLSTSHFSLKKINILYSQALNGSYSLDSNDNIMRDNLATNIFFADKETLTEEDIQRSDFLKGTSIITLGVNNSNVDISNSQRFMFNSSYGGFDKGSISLESSYSRNLIDTNLKEESFQLLPKINLILSGNKSDGLSLRNHYIVNNSFDYFSGKETNSFSNNLGVYKNNNRFYYGMYLGSGLITNETESKVKIFGAEFNFFKKNNVFKSTYTKQLTEKASVQSFSLNAFLNYSQDFVFRAGIRWSEQKNQLSNLNNFIGNLGFTWIFGAGNFTLYDQLKNLNTKIKGKVFFDKNLSSTKDDNEDMLDVKILNYGDRIFLKDGEFEISSLENQKTKLTIESDKYAIYNPIFQAKSGTNYYNVSVYEKQTTDLFFKMNGDSILDVNIEFICDNQLKHIKPEVFSEKFVVDLPKNMDCFVQLSSDESRYIIKSIDKKEKLIIVELEKNLKRVYFDFNKKVLSITIDNKMYNSKNIEYVFEKEQDISVKIPEKCKSTPKIVDSKIIFSQLKSQNFYSIDCD